MFLTFNLENQADWFTYFKAASNEKVA